MVLLSFSQYIQHPWLGNYFLHLVDGGHALQADLGGVQGVIQPTPTGHAWQASDWVPWWYSQLHLLGHQVSTEGLVSSYRHERSESS